MLFVESSQGVFDQVISSFQAQNHEIASSNTPVAMTIYFTFGQSQHSSLHFENPHPAIGQAAVEDAVLQILHCTGFPGFFKSAGEQSRFHRNPH